MALGIKRVVLAPATQTTAGASSAQSTVSLPDGMLNLFVNVTAAVAPGGHLRVWPEWSDDGGTTWYQSSDELFLVIYFIDVAPAAQVRSFPIHSDKYRVAWEFVGTSYTFGVNSFGALL